MLLIIRSLHANRKPPRARSLLAQVITDFCKEIGAEGKLRQDLIRTAKKNGGLLGFLA